MNLVPKSRLEKLGDYLSTPFHRFIFSLVTVIPFLIFAVINIMSILTSTRTRFIANVVVPGKDGRMIPCAIVKRQYHAYMPVVPFFSFFFYVPYKVDYFILHNVSLPTLSAGTKISEGLIAINSKTQITKGTAMAIIACPSRVSGALEMEIENAKNQFHTNIKPYIDAKVLRITHETDAFTVYSFPDDSDVLICHYGNHTDTPIVACFSAQTLTQCLNNPAALYMTYASGNFNVIKLNTATLERLISIRNNNQQETTQEQTPTAEPEQVPESVNEHIENAKKPLTKELVEKDLKFHTSSTKKAGAYVFAFLSLFAVELAIAGLIFALPMGIIFCVASFFLIRTTIRRFKTAKANKAKLDSKQYYILKVKCIQADAVTQESDDGNYTVYTLGFENGYTFNPPMQKGIEGDWFYLVYLAGNDKPVTMYNAVEYRPEPDLKIETYSK